MHCQSKHRLAKFSLNWCLVCTDVKWIHCVFVYFCMASSRLWWTWAFQNKSWIRMSPKIWRIRKNCGNSTRFGFKLNDIRGVLWCINSSCVTSMVYSDVLTLFQAVMVGDDIVSDVGGAQACGIRGLQVRTGKYRFTLLSVYYTPSSPLGLHFLC